MKKIMLKTDYVKSLSEKSINVVYRYINDSDKDKVNNAKYKAIVHDSKNNTAYIIIGDKAREVSKATKQPIYKPSKHIDKRYYTAKGDHFDCCSNHFGNFADWRGL